MEKHCKECKFFKVPKGAEDGDYMCTHKECFDEREFADSDTGWTKKIVRVKNRYDLNKNYDCRHYVEK